MLQQPGQTEPKVRVYNLRVQAFALPSSLSPKDLPTVDVIVVIIKIVITAKLH